MLTRTRSVRWSACVAPTMLMFLLHGWRPCWAQAPVPAPTLQGVVVDTTGARVAHAAVHLQSGGHEQNTRTDGAGHFEFTSSAGLCRLTIDFPGFDTFKMTVNVSASGEPAEVRAVLRIAPISQEIVVDDDTGASSNAAENKNAIVFTSQDLNMFSEDNATFQKQILAFLGAGVGSPQIYVNGFSSGHIPPKSSIREVRFNRNPYSALFDTMGNRRVDFITRAGGDKLHGSLDATGNDIDFNSLNPYNPGPQPPYYSLTADGNLSGPIGRKSTFFVGGTYNNQQNNAAVNAVVLSNLQPVSFYQAVPNPITSSIFTARVDRVLTENNTFTGSYEFDQTNVTNGSVGLLVLPSEGFNNGTTSQTLQLSDTQAVGMKMLLESRLQYMRSRLQQGAVSDAATIVVQGDFNGGGSPQQQLIDDLDNFEFQQYFSRQQGAHFFRVGGRYRSYRDSNFSTANYNGQFLFSTLTGYQLTLQNTQICAQDPTSPACLTPAQLAAAGGGASQYSVTTGKKSAVALTGDLALFAEDEWKVNKSITVDLGFRFESQSGVPDHIDPAPRLGAAWAIYRKKERRPFVVLRGGAGIFYDRFTAANLLTSIRQNGVTQQTYIENLASYPSPTIAVPPTTYTLSPNLHTEYGLYLGGSAEKMFGRIGQASISYTGIHGVHQYLSRNINAPLPGTYDPTVPGRGTRPLGGDQNIYQFDSSGTLNAQIVAIQTRLNLSKRVVAYVVYSDVMEKADASSANAFVSNSYDVSADYGRVAAPAHDLVAGGMVQLPFGISTNLYFAAKSGIPFNITTGTDLNGDGQFNDRPTFATDLTRPSVVQTRFGNFDTQPTAGQKLVPFDYGDSPSFYFLDVTLERSFAVGPRPAKKAAEKAGPAPGRPFSVNFQVDAQNIFNHVNSGTPIGVVGSSLFGKSISLSTDLSTNTAANRLIMLHAAFEF
jgi:hypothetical protein